MSGAPTLSVTIHLGVVETAVLRALPGPEAETFPNASGLWHLTGFSHDVSLAACRALAAMGLVECARGLFDPATGLAAGSGWHLTYAGVRALKEAEAGASVATPSSGAGAPPSPARGEGEGAAGIARGAQ